MSWCELFNKTKIVVFAGTTTDILDAVEFAPLVVENPCVHVPPVCCEYNVPVPDGVK